MWISGLVDRMGGGGGGDDELGYIVTKKECRVG